MMLRIVKNDTGIKELSGCKYVFKATLDNYTLYSKIRLIALFSYLLVKLSDAKFVKGKG